MAYIRIYLNDVLLNQIELVKDELTIGRNPNCDLVIDSQGVSSHHATLKKEKGLYVIEDNNSTNGIFINGQRVNRHVLNYRDEIQLHDHVLKYMATAGLTDEVDPDLVQDMNQDDGKTVEISIAGVAELMKLRNRKKTAYLEVMDASHRKSQILISSPPLRIGRSQASDLRTSGWFSPAIAAEIEKRHDGYYLVPKRRGKSKINNQLVKTATRLADGDRLRIRNLEPVFRHHLVKD